MDNPYLNKNSSLKLNRVNSHQLKRKKMQNNYNKKQTINSYKKVLDQFDTNFPFSPKKKKKSGDTFKTNISKKSLNNSSILQSSIDIKKHHISSSYTNLSKFINKNPKNINPALIQRIHSKVNSNIAARRRSVHMIQNKSSFYIENNHFMSPIKKKRTHMFENNKKKNIFNFFEKPELFDDIIQIKNTSTTNFNKKRTFMNDNNDDNISIYSIMNRHSITKLNDIQKELKKSVIGFSNQKFDSRISKLSKSFLVDDDEDEDEDEDDKESYKSDENNSEKNEEKENIEKDRLRVLQRMGNVYDSLDEEDITISTTYIHPDLFFLKIIDFLVFIFSIFNLIYVPFFLGLKTIHCRKNSFLTFLNFIEIIMDITYFIDLIIPFFTAYYTLDDILKTNLKEIGSAYLKSYFIIDLCAALPFRLMFEIFDTECKDQGYLNAPLYQNNVHYCLLLLRLPKAIKAFFNNRISDYLSNYLNQYEHFNNYLGLYSGFIITVTCMHIMACTFIFIGKCEYPGWIINYGYQDLNYSELYLIAIYYIITTCTTVGYGDLTCITLVEKIFGLIMEIVGIFAYSFAVSSISNYVKVMNDKSEEYREKSEILEDIRISYPELDDDLYHQIHRYLKFKFLCHEKLDKKVIINSLPLTLKNSLVCEMYEPLIKNFIFFKNFDNIDFIVRVILCFKPILAVRNDILIKDGDFVEDMIFVKRGRLSLDLPLRIEEEEEINKSKSGRISSVKTFKSLKKSKTIFTRVMTHIEENDEEERKEEDDENIQYYKILDIRKNEHFGDILMFLNKRSPLRVKVKSRTAELFYLNKKDAIEISQSYSQIWNQINKKSLFNWEQIKRLMIKVTKLFTKANGINIDEESQNNGIYFSTDLEDNTDLQSIPTLSFLNDSQKKENKEELESNRLTKINTLKNQEFKQLNTIKESNSFESIEEECQNEESRKYESDNSKSFISNNKTMKTLRSLKTKTIKYRSESSDDDDSSESESNSSNLKSSKDDVNNNDINDNFDDNNSDDFINVNTLRIEEQKKNYYSEKYSLNNSLKKNNNDVKKIKTPYKPNEINNEIYPDETFITYSNITTNEEYISKKITKNINIK